MHRKNSVLFTYDRMVDSDTESVYIRLLKLQHGFSMLSLIVKPKQYLRRSLLKYLQRGSCLYTWAKQEYVIRWCLTDTCLTNPLSSVGEPVGNLRAMWFEEKMNALKMNALSGKVESYQAAPVPVMNKRQCIFQSLESHHSWNYFSIPKMLGCCVVVGVCVTFLGNSHSNSPFSLSNKWYFLLYAVFHIVSLVLKRKKNKQNQFKAFYHGKYILKHNLHDFKVWHGDSYGDIFSHGTDSKLRMLVDTKYWFSTRAL